MPLGVHQLKGERTRKLLEVTPEAHRVAHDYKRPSCTVTDKTNVLRSNIADKRSSTEFGKCNGSNQSTESTIQNSSLVEKNNNDSNIIPLTIQNQNFEPREESQQQNTEINSVNTSNKGTCKIDQMQVRQIIAKLA